MSAAKNQLNDGHNHDAEQKPVQASDEYLFSFNLHAAPRYGDLNRLSTAE